MSTREKPAALSADSPSSEGTRKSPQFQRNCEIRYRAWEAQPFDPAHPEYRIFDNVKRVYVGKSYGTACQARRAALLLNSFCYLSRQREESSGSTCNGRSIGSRSPSSSGTRETGKVPNRGSDAVCGGRHQAQHSAADVVRRSGGRLPSGEPSQPVRRRALPQAVRLFSPSSVGTRERSKLVRPAKLVLAGFGLTVLLTVGILELRSHFRNAGAEQQESQPSRVPLFHLGRKSRV